MKRVYLKRWLEPQDGSRWMVVTRCNEVDTTAWILVGSISLPMRYHSRTIRFPLPDNAPNQHQLPCISHEWYSPEDYP